MAQPTQIYCTIVSNTLLHIAKLASHKCISQLLLECMCVRWVCIVDVAFAFDYVHRYVFQQVLIQHRPHNRGMNIIHSVLNCPLLFKYELHRISDTGKKEQRIALGGQKQEFFIFGNSNYGSCAFTHTLSLSYYRKHRISWNVLVFTIPSARWFMYSAIFWLARKYSIEVQITTYDSLLANVTFSRLYPMLARMKWKALGEDSLRKFLFRFST